MRLDRNTLNELTDLLAPSMRSESARRALLIEALIDIPLLDQIEYGGSTRTFIINMISRLIDYGELASGQPALWALMETVRAQVGPDKQRRIDALQPVLNPSGVAPAARAERPPAVRNERQPRAERPPAARNDSDRFKVEIRISARREGARSDEGCPVTLKLESGGEYVGSLPADLSDLRAQTDGRKLFHALFPGDLSGVWKATRNRKESLRVLLQIDWDAPDEVHSIPWERLEDGFATLSADADTPFSRFIATKRNVESVTAELPIRGLVVISAPTDLADLGLAEIDAARERAALEKVFESVGADKVEVTYLQAPVTRRRLRDALRDAEYHFLHFIGHGKYSRRDSRAQLYLQNDDGSHCLEPASRIVKMLDQLPGRDLPRLVFLAACQSAEGGTDARVRLVDAAVRETDDAFLGLGPKLVTIGVPAVIAMQGRVTPATARNFSTEFYLRLLKHGFVDLAANEARSELTVEGRADAAMPVLFMRLKDGRLFAPDGTSAPATLSVPPAVTTRPDASKPAPSPFKLRGARLDFEPEWVDIPAGPFLMGSESNDREAFMDETPKHEVNIDAPFAIARTPITNLQYRVFVDATGHRQPKHWQLSEFIGDCPVVQVNWRDALAYCAWLTQALRDAGRFPAGLALQVRLPTEAEWEKAARGVDGRRYPWGEARPDDTLLNFANRYGGPSPVGKYPGGASPYGCLDMAGNVWEWTLSGEKSYPYVANDGRERVEERMPRRITRGGAYSSMVRHVRCAVRNWHTPEKSGSRDAAIGFRVVLRRA